MKNPLQKIKEERGWTLEEFATVTDTSSSTIYKNLKGSNFKITDRILKTLKQLDYDTEKIKTEYQKFREAKKQELIRG